MDFSWSAEQLEHRQKVVEFARENLNGDIVERDREGTFSWENWQRCADFGIQGMCVPETYSGSPALDITTAVLAMEGLGYGCEDNGLTLALNAQM
ncbi:MAG: acyl-CoA dehydrogenase family protein, partial [Cyanobacteria bacterium J06648_11]